MVHWCYDVMAYMLIYEICHFGKGIGLFVCIVTVNDSKYCSSHCERWDIDIRQGLQLKAMGG